MAGSGSTTWLQAEQYRSLEDVSERYQPHPEGMPSVRQNCLLVGYPGVGKTMVLRKLCHQLMDKQDDILPLYIKIEPWIAKISGEAAYSSNGRRSPRDVELLISARILLSMAFIDRAFYITHSFDLIQSAVSQFPAKLSAAPSADNYELWKMEHFAVLKGVLEAGKELPRAYAEFPTLFEIVNAIATSSLANGKTLVLLVDQIDKASAIHFECVSSLLRRGDYVAIIATRPCPCAPDDVELPRDGGLQSETQSRP
jgi:hypothetical protein